jgi:hypothetical protein
VLSTRYDKRPRRRLKFAGRGSRQTRAGQVPRGQRSRMSSTRIRIAIPRPDSVTRAVVVAALAGALVAGCGSTKTPTASIQSRVRTICARISSAARVVDAKEHTLANAYHAGKISPQALERGLASDLTATGDSIQRGTHQLLVLQPHRGGSAVLRRLVADMGALTNGLFAEARASRDDVGVRAAASFNDRAIDAVNRDASRMGLSGCVT